jgi:hypothetical protein
MDRNLAFSTRQYFVDMAALQQKRPPEGGPGPGWRLDQ